MFVRYGNFRISSADHATKLLINQSLLQILQTYVRAPSVTPNRCDFYIPGTARFRVPDRPPRVVIMSSPGGLSVLLQTVANASFHNPVEPYIASGWNYMTDNYSRFTIAMWISIVLHEVKILQKMTLRLAFRSVSALLLVLVITGTFCIQTDHD